MPGSSTTLSIIVKLIDEASAAMGTIGTNLQSTLEKNKAGIQTLAIASGAAFAGIGAEVLGSVSNFTTWNEKIQRAGSYVNASAEQLQQFRDIVMSVSNQTGVSADIVAQGLGAFVGGGITAQEAVANLGDVIKLKLIANMSDMNQAADYASNSLVVFGNQGLTMSDVLDNIANVASNVTVQTDQWANSVAQSSGAAKAAGLSFNDMSTILAAMVQGGTQVANTWAPFNDAIKMTESPTKQAKVALAGVGESVQGLQEALKGGAVTYLEYLKEGFAKANETGQGFAFLVHTVGAIAAPAMANAFNLSGTQLNTLANSFTTAKGSGEQMAKTMENAIPPLTRLATDFDDLQKSIGQALAPAIDALVKALEPVLSAIATWVSEHPKLAAALILGALLVTGLVFALSTLGLAILAMTPVFALLGVVAGAFSLPLLALIALVALLAYLWIFHWNEIKGGAQVILDWLHSTFTTWGDAITKWWKGMWDNILSIFNNAVSMIKSAASAIAAPVSAVMGAVGAAWSAIGGAIHAFASGGIVTSPTLALVGEAGPEAIIPLSAFAGGTSLRGGTGAAGSINITIAGGMYLDSGGATMIANQIGKQIMQQLKLKNFN